MGAAILSRISNNSFVPFVTPPENSSFRIVCGVKGETRVRRKAPGSLPNRSFLHCLAAHKIINFRKSDSSVICLSLALDQITLITFSEALLACHVFLSTKQQKVYSSFLLASYCVSFLVCNKKYRQYEVQQQDDAHIVGKISIR